MDDMEMTKACAEAMGYGIEISHGEAAIYEKLNGRLLLTSYDPLHDNAQAMELVKKFHLDLAFAAHLDKWCVGGIMTELESVYDDNLNRAIVECVAKMKVDGNEKEKA